MDFDEMAKAARAKSQGIVDLAAEKERTQKEAEARRLEDAQRFLAENVMPLLQQAAQAFRNSGVDTKIDATKAWRLVGSGSSGETLPIHAIEFRCFSSLEKPRLGQREVQGERYVFEHDGTSLTWKLFSSNRASQKFMTGTIESFVCPVVEKALDSYYSKLREMS